MIMHMSILAMHNFNIHCLGICQDMHVLDHLISMRNQPCSNPISKVKMMTCKAISLYLLENLWKAAKLQRCQFSA